MGWCPLTRGAAVPDKRDQVPCPVHVMDSKIPVRTMDSEKRRVVRRGGRYKAEKGSDERSETFLVFFFEKQERGRQRGREGGREGGRERKRIR